MGVRPLLFLFSTMGRKRKKQRPDPHDKSEKDRSDPRPALSAASSSPRPPRSVHAAGGRRPFGPDYRRTGESRDSRALPARLFSTETRGAPRERAPEADSQLRP